MYYRFKYKGYFKHIHQKIKFEESLHTTFFLFNKIFSFGEFFFAHSLNHVSVYPWKFQLQTAWKIFHYVWNIFLYIWYKVGIL